MDDLDMRHNPTAFRYEAWLGMQLVGQIDYRIAGRVLTVTHTGTRPQNRGTGIAAKLTQFMMDDVRTKHQKIVPLCPYTKAWIADHPLYQAALVAS